MDEGILCEAGKVERGMVCEKSRGSGDPQQCPGLYGDQQREGEGPVAERKQGCGGGGDKPLLSVSVDVGT